MNKYDIWSEGYSATGGNGTAHYFGTVEAGNFKEACDLLAKKDIDFNKYYNRNAMTFWGCGLYDNEYDARKNFG